MIGIIDSGIGGLGLWKALKKENIPHGLIYISDSRYMPYGQKNTNEICQRLHHLTLFLLKKRCSLIVLACNTATVQGISFLRRTFPQSVFIGMEPAIKPASYLSQNKKIGLLATAGTIRSERITNLIDTFAPHCQFFFQEDKGLAESIEKTGDAPSELIQAHTLFVRQEGIDTLILGCSHYPLIAASIKKEIPQKTLLLNTEESVSQYLKKSYPIDLCEQEEDEFLTTDTEKKNEWLFSQILQKKVVLHVLE